MNEIKQFFVHSYQYLNEQGVLVNSDVPLAQDFEQLRHLYKTMVLVRTFDKKAIALQRTGKMGTYAPINGQEAISTAIGHALKKEDVLVPYYRDYGAMILRGIKMSEILSYWGGDERGSDYKNNQEDLPICVPIASQCLHAAGVAFAFKYRNQERVALVTIGEGGTSEGDFYEAMNVAGAWNLPVVFIVNNNQWAISVPISQQTACETIAQKAIAAGFNGVRVDGNDVIACQSEISKAIENARNGGGPTLIEAMTYRLCDHTTADDATRYQPEAEVKAAKLKEPISRLKHYLQSANQWSSSDEEQLVIDASNEVEQAVEEYLSQKTQPISSMFEYHYQDMPDYLVEQCQLAMEEHHA